MATDDKPRCGTCRYYDRPVGDKYDKVKIRDEENLKLRCGHPYNQHLPCQRSSEDWIVLMDGESIPDEACAIISKSGTMWAGMYPGPMFGCVLHEEKEREKTIDEILPDALL